MKILTVFVLGWAIVALTGAHELEEQEDETELEEEEEQTELEAEDDQTEKSALVKRFLFCHRGWISINGACFKYVTTAMSWARAEKNCQSMGGHLASVLSNDDHKKIQRLTATYGYTPTWIGGSDAQENNVWLWTDGEKLTYTNWCSGEPSNYRGLQNCLVTNHSEKKCWDDLECNYALPSICAIRGWGLVG